MPRSQHFILCRPSTLGALHLWDRPLLGPSRLLRAATLAVSGLRAPGEARLVSLCGVGKSSKAVCLRRLETSVGQS